MLTVSSLSAAELRRRLSGPGLQLQTGSIQTRIRSSIPAIADNIGLLYADYPVDEAAPFADFHVELGSGKGLRRWLRPQSRFVLDGKEPFRPLPLEQAFAMFEWGMNWCITANAASYLIVHAAVLEKNGCAVMMPAPPGSGKSTLTAALASNGWRLLSDELAMLRLGDGQLEPLPRPVSLKNRSIEVIRDYVPSAVLGKVVLDTHKGSISHMKPPPGAVARAGETARPAWIIFPKYEASAAATLEALPRARCFMDVALNAFNYTNLGQRGFDTLAGLVERCDAYQFRYSKLDEALAIFSRLSPPRA